MSQFGISAVVKWKAEDLFLTKSRLLYARCLR